RSPVRLDRIGAVELLQEVGDLAHLHVGVRAARPVPLLRIELVPPLVAAPERSRAVELLAIVELEDLSAVVLVGAGQPDPLAGREEGDRAETDAVELDRERVEIRQKAPLGRELFERDVDALATRIRLSAVRESGRRRRVRGALGLSGEREGAPLELADAVEVIGDARPRRGTERRTFARVALVLIDDGVEDAPAEPKAPRLLGVVRQVDEAEHAIEEIPGRLLHRGRDRAIVLVAVDVAADSASSEEGPGDDRRDRPFRKPVGVGDLADHLIEGRTSRARLAVGRLRGEGARRAVIVRVDPGFVATDLVDVTEDGELLLERPKRLEHAIEAFLL